VRETEGSEVDGPAAIEGATVAAAPVGKREPGVVVVEVAWEGLMTLEGAALTAAGRGSRFLWAKWACRDLLSAETKPNCRAKQMRATVSLILKEWQGIKECVDDRERK
jgi:hypothetical protein